MTFKKPQYPAGRRSFIAAVHAVAALSATPFVFPSLTYGKTMKTSDDAVLVAQAPAARPADRELDPPLHLPRSAKPSSMTFAGASPPTRLPENEPVADFSQGVKLATMQKLAQYWAKEYDWRKVEARLSALPQFITEIDGLDIHFIHVRSKHENALPIIVTHGWPGSVIEQLKIIDPLVNPTAHGGKASDAFHVVVPSMPGYGFSGKPTRTGWGPERIARAWARADEAHRVHGIRGARRRLGRAHRRRDGQCKAARNCSASTPTCPARFRPPSTRLLQRGARRRPASRPRSSTRSSSSRSSIRTASPTPRKWATRPQTLYGVADSPVGLAAWFLDHDARSLELISRVFDGQPEGLTRDDVLDNITLLLVDEYGGLLVPSVLGKHVQLISRRRASPSRSP